MVPALDLERHAPRALLAGLFVAFLLHATLIAYGKLMPPLPKRLPHPVPLRPIDVDVEVASAAPLHIDVDETTIEVPAPVRATVKPPAPPVPPPTPAQAPPPAPVHEPPPVPVVEEAPPPAPAPPVVLRAAPPPIGPDRSAPARLGGNVTWKCPWPQNADPEIRHIAVRVQAEVRVDGSPTAVRIVHDPGYGFAEAARRCAMGHMFVPARDRGGAPSAGETLPFTVYFDR